MTATTGMDLSILKVSYPKLYRSLKVEPGVRSALGEGWAAGVMYLSIKLDELNRDFMLTGMQVDVVDIGVRFNRIRVLFGPCQYVKQPRFKRLAWWWACTVQWLSSYIDVDPFVGSAAPGFFNRAYEIVNETQLFCDSVCASCGRVKSLTGMPKSTLCEDCQPKERV